MFSSAAFWFQIAVCLAVFVLSILLWRRIGLVRQRDNMWATLLSKTPWDDTPFDPATIAELPEPARRFLSFALPEGTPLRPIAIVCSRSDGETSYTLVAAPFGRLKRGYGKGLSIVEGFYGGDRLLHRWLFKIIPLRWASEPVLQAMIDQVALEAALWTPAALYKFATDWTEIADDSIRVSLQFGDRTCQLDLAVSPIGALISARVVGSALTAIPTDYATSWGPQVPTRVQFSNAKGLVSVANIRLVEPYRGIRTVDCYWSRPPHAAATDCPS